MTKHPIVVVIAVLLICVGLSGCTESNQTGVLTSTKPPVNINTFASAKEGELIRFYFLLEDEDGANAISDGHAKIEIFGDSNNSLYFNEFNVKSSEFVDYAFKLTGTNIGKAYEWRVLTENIEKGILLIGFGKAVLTFITPDYNILYAEDTLVQIPTYTEQELKDIQEEDFEESAISVNKRISKGNFEITVIRVGFFVSYEWGEQQECFRVDMGVKNIGTESEYFMPDGLAIIDNQNNQYEQNYLGTLDIISTIYPSVTKKGYYLFEGISKTVTSVKLVFKLGYDLNFNSYLFEYNINLNE